MSLTPNYDPNPLYAKLIISNPSLTYTFESKPIAATPGSPIQNFKLLGYRLHLGMNDDFGTLAFQIHDHSGIFVDYNDPDRPSTIGREWSVQLYLGKTLAGLQRWFYGKIKEVQISRDSTNLQFVNITAVGWGIILRERMTRIVRNQAKQSDGITLDDTDNTTQIDNIILDLFRKTDHYIDDKISQLGNITATSTTDGTGLCSDCLAGVKIANINYTISSFAQVVSNLSSVANTNWTVDYDRNLVIHDPRVHDSGFLFTNNLNGDKAQRWSNSKIGYILNTPLQWSDSSADTYYSMVHAYGHFSPKLDKQDNQTPNASLNLDTVSMAIPFTTPTDNIFKIAIRATKSGTITADGKLEIWGVSAATPSSLDIRRSIMLNKTTIDSLGTTTPAKWFEIPIRPRLDVTPNEQLYLVFHKYGTAGNTFNVDYKTATGTYYDSPDRVTWTARTGSPAYRIYSASRLITTLENTRIKRLLSEPFSSTQNYQDTTTQNTLNYQATTAASLNGTLRVCKFTGLTSGDIISTVAFNVATAAGNIRVKVYQDDGTSGAPSTLLAESGSIAVGGTGIQTFALTTPATVPASGNVWVGFETDSATLSLYRTTGLTSGTTRTVTHVYGTGPTPFGAGTNQTYGTWTRISAIATGTLYAQKFTGLRSGNRVLSVALNVAQAGGNIRIKVYQDDLSQTKTLDYQATTATTLNGVVSLCKFIGLSPNGSISSVSLKVGTAAGNVRVKVYAADGISGAPKTLLGESNSTTVAGTGVQAYPLTSNAIIPTNGIVWVGFECDSASLVLNRTNSLTSGTTKTITHTYGSGPSIIETTTDQTYGYYMELLITSGDPKTLIAESGSLAVSGTGIQTYSLGATIPSTGNIWIGIEVDSPTLSLYRTTGLTSGTVKSITHVYGAGPDPFGAGTDRTFGFWMDIDGDVYEIRERMFPIRADLEEQTVRQTMLSVGDLFGKQHRAFQTVRISPTTDRIPINEFCYLEDAKTGLFVRATIETIELGATAMESGATVIELGLSSLR